MSASQTVKIKPLANLPLINRAVHELKFEFLIYLSVIKLILFKLTLTLTLFRAVIIVVLFNARTKQNIYSTAMETAEEGPRGVRSHSRAGELFRHRIEETFRVSADGRAGLDLRSVTYHYRALPRFGKVTFRTGCANDEIGMGSGCQRVGCCFLLHF